MKAKLAVLTLMVLAAAGCTRTSDRTTDTTTTTDTVTSTDSTSGMTNSDLNNNSVDTSTTSDATATGDAAATAPADSSMAPGAAAAPTTDSNTNMSDKATHDKKAKKAKKGEKKGAWHEYTVREDRSTASSEVTPNIGAEGTILEDSPVVNTTEPMYDDTAAVENETSDVDSDSVSGATSSASTLSRSSMRMQELDRNYLIQGANPDYGAIPFMNSPVGAELNMIGAPVRDLTDDIGGG